MMPLPRTLRGLVAALAFLAPLAAFAADIPAAQRRSGYEFMGRQTRAIEDDDAANPGMLAVLDGEVLWNRGEGPAGKSCASCHDDNWGQKLGGAVIPQAHPTGYPLYRLEWQSLGSLRRRLRNCLVGMRAEPYPEDAPEIVDLELYLAWRARGLVMETPAVRP